MIFRRAMGATVMEYLSHKRVTYAQQLLINGLPAAQTAEAAGFGDYTSFYRHYVKHFGRSPNRDYSRLTREQSLLLREMTDMPPAAGRTSQRTGTESLWERLPEIKPGEESGS